MTDHVLYRMFDKSNVLLYVGITNNPKGRFTAHSKSQPWWSEVSTISVHTLGSRSELEAAERAAIRAEHPRYNIALRPSQWNAPDPKCPTCLAPKPELMPVDEVLLMEDGTLMPFCTDPFHFPDDAERAAKVHAQRELLKQSTLLRLSDEAKRRMERRRELMEDALSFLVPVASERAS